MRLQDVIRLLRVKQWVKNLLVFTGIIFAGKLTEPAFLLTAVLVFIAFSIAASSVYILNDMRDREADRQHPKKQHRPLASGRISMRQAWSILAILILVLISILSILPWKAQAIIGGYILFNLAYTLWLKHMLILDVYSIAVNFILRILAGTTGIGIAPSAWLLLFFLFSSLYFAYDKRLYEARTGAARRVFRAYTKDYLERMRSSMLSLLIITYGIYALFKQAGNAWFLLSVALLTAAFSLHELGSQKGDFFEEALISPGMFLILAAWFLSVLLGLYSSWQPIHLTL